MSFFKVCSFLGNTLLSLFVSVCMSVYSYSAETDTLNIQSVTHQLRCFYQSLGQLEAVALHATFKKYGSENIMAYMDCDNRMYVLLNSILPRAVEAKRFFYECCLRELGFDVTYNLNLQFDVDDAGAPMTILRYCKYPVLDAAIQNKLNKVKTLQVDFIDFERCIALLSNNVVDKITLCNTTQHDGVSVYTSGLSTYLRTYYNLKIRLYATQLLKDECENYKRKINSFIENEYLLEVVKFAEQKLLDTNAGISVCKSTLRTSKNGSMLRVDAIPEYFFHTEIMYQVLVLNGKIKPASNCMISAKLSCKNCDPFMKKWVDALTYNDVKNCLSRGNNVDYKYFIAIATLGVNTDDIGKYSQSISAVSLLPRPNSTGCDVHGINNVEAILGGGKKVFYPK